MKIVRMFVVGLLLVVTTSCAPLLQSYEEPRVSLSSFRMLPGASLVPDFEIGLHVINPNPISLTLAGVSYAIELEGTRILSGVVNQLPEIEAYGEGDLLIQARPELLNTITLFTQLLNQPRASFAYKFEALLDVGTFIPNIQIVKEGAISLGE